MKRDYSIEIFRIVLVLGICFMHVVGHASVQPTWWLRGAFAWCVPGFILITGWYGTKFSWMKIIRLFGVQLYCVAVIQLLILFQDYRVDPVIAVRQFKGSWFLNGYVVLLCFVPMLNKMLEENAIRTLLPVLAVVFGWGFVSTMPLIGSLVPQANGVGPYSGVMMIGVYVGARILRLSNMYTNIPRRWILTTIPIALALGSLGFGEYCSPIAFFIAASMLLVFRGILVADFIGKITTLVSPSLFSVYLLHVNSFGFEKIKELESYLILIGCPLVLVYILGTLAVFGITLVLDIPRRVMISIIRKCHALLKSRKA